MEIDTVLILGGGIDEIVGQSGHRRKFIPGLLVEIGIAGAAVQRAVADADIREPGSVVGAGRNIAGQVGHDVMDAGIPAQRELRRQVPKTRHRVADRVEPGSGDRKRSDQHGGGEGQVVGGPLAAVGRRQCDRRLTAENRRRERI
jgi:hypothetical protein